MAILVDRDTKLVVQGLTGREGSFHGLRNREYGTDLVAGVTPGKGGQDVEGVPVFDTMHEAVAADRRQHRRWCSCRRRSPPTRSSRPPTRASSTIICITEGIPAHDMLRVYNYLAGHRLAADRAELPGRAVARQGQRRDHPGALLLARAASALLSRSGTLTYQIGNELAQLRRRQLDHRRDRRRPDHRQLVHRRDLALRAGRPDRADRDGRRDRRRRGGETAEYIAEHVTQAGGRLHRRLHRAAGQAHGPRRRDHLGLVGHGAGEGRSARGEGRAGRARTRPRSREIAAERVGSADQGRSRTSDCGLRSPAGSYARAPARSASPAALPARHHACRGGRASARTRVLRGRSRGRALLRAPARATRRCASGSPSGTASQPERVMVTNGSLQGGVMLFDQLVEPGERGRSSRRRRTTARCLRCASAAPTAWRSRSRTTASTSARWSRRSSAGARPKLRRTRSRTSTTRPAARSRSRSAERAARAGGRARLPDLRGRPVRRAALRGRGPARDARARTPPTASSTRARSRRRSRPACGSDT